jgi:hypothetical protein
MNMVFGMIAFAVLAVLYGLTWHDQSAREPAISPRNNRKQEAR